MSGDTVRLVGPAARSLASAIDVLAGYDCALVGGLAVMARLGTVHRGTEDLDSVFDNPSDVPTTLTLVRHGVATDDAAPQRVTINDTVVDVIDTFALPADSASLPDEPQGRLFVCAHRYAYETATPVMVVTDDGERSAIRIAAPAGLVATKAHALRFGRANRRRTKRTSDLYDVFRLVDAHPRLVEDLATAPWQLGLQVGIALRHDLADLEQGVATLRGSAVVEINSVDADRFVEAVGRLLEALPAE